MEKSKLVNFFMYNCILYKTVLYIHRIWLKIDEELKMTGKYSSKAKVWKDDGIDYWGQHLPEVCIDELTKNGSETEADESSDDDLSLESNEDDTDYQNISKYSIFFIKSE